MLFRLDEIKGYTLYLKCFWMWQNIGNCYSFKKENIKDLNSVVIHNKKFIFSKQTMYSDFLV